MSELQSSINALRRQNWSQLPDRAPLDLVDPVIVNTSTTAAAASGSSVGGALPPAAATSASSAISMPSRNSGNDNHIFRLFSTFSLAFQLIVPIGATKNAGVENVLPSEI